jgi:hypothetical protein
MSNDLASSPDAANTTHWLFRNVGLVFFSPFLLDRFLNAAFWHWLKAAWEDKVRRGRREGGRERERARACDDRETDLARQQRWNWRALSLFLSFFDRVYSLAGLIRSVYVWTWTCFPRWATFRCATNKRTNVCFKQNSYFCIIHILWRSNIHGTWNHTEHSQPSSRKQLT